MKKPRITNKHHIIHESKEHKQQKDYVVVIWKGEHRVLSLIEWTTKNNVSEGFIRALKIYVAMNEWRAVPLDAFEGEQIYIAKGVGAGD